MLSFDMTLYLCDQIAREVEFRSDAAIEEWEWTRAQVQAMVTELVRRHGQQWRKAFEEEETSAAERTAA